LKYALRSWSRLYCTYRTQYVNQLEDINLPLEYELQIFLIIRESLVNIATHSGASIARLTITCIEGQYQFAVEDNGGGVGDSAPPEGHYGLEIMRERALRIGGRLVWKAGRAGTRVQLILCSAEPGMRS
jgi:nitrate/nitrite-specific signal transduction histidine kinase